MEFYPSLENRSHKMVVQFCSHGSSVTNAECVVNLGQFVKHYGGPHGEAQWASVKGVNSEIWMAACAIWGWPVCIEEGHA